jgi:bifunctional DNase/RNase
MTPVRIRTLTASWEAPHAALVLEAPTTGQRLAFMLPTSEASRLARVLGLTPCGCAPVYELIGTLVAGLRATVAGAVIHATGEGIVAALVLEGETGRLEIPCHPADALGLATRASAPMFATAEALAHAGPPPESRGVDVTAWLDGLRPGDFDRPGPA